KVRLSPSHQASSREGIPHRSGRSGGNPAHGLDIAVWNFAQPLPLACDLATGVASWRGGKKKGSERGIFLKRKALTHEHFFMDLCQRAKWCNSGAPLWQTERTGADVGYWGHKAARGSRRLMPWCPD